MCRNGGTMQPEEYKQEIRDIKALAMKELEQEKDDEIFEVTLRFRDDFDLICNGIENKIFKHFDSVKKYIAQESDFLDYDRFYQYCIYESKDRSGLWIDDISDSQFTDYVYFYNSPLERCEPAEGCPDEKLMRVSRILKENPELWYKLCRICFYEIKDGKTSLEKWIFSEENNENNIS